MKEINLLTKAFNWGGHKEFIIEKDAFKIFNRNTGKQNSTFFLKSGSYKLILSLESLNLDNCFSYFKGDLKLSGTEEENKWLEENITSKEHKRNYSIFSNDIGVSITKEYLVENDLFEKKLFIYLIKEDYLETVISLELASLIFGEKISFIDTNVFVGQFSHKVRIIGETFDMDIDVNYLANLAKQWAVKNDLFISSTIYEGNKGAVARLYKNEKRIHKNWYEEEYIAILKMATYIHTNL